MLGTLLDLEKLFVGEEYDVSTFEHPIYAHIRLASP